MKNLNIITYGIIITDKNNIITDCNYFINTMLNNDNIIGKSINDFENDLKCYDIQIGNIKDGSIYIINNQNSNEFWDIILENAHDEIFVTDKNGIALYCNSAFEKHYGLSKEEMLGKHVKYLEENNYADITYMTMVLESKKEITFEQKTKTNRTILNTSTPIFNNKNEIIYGVENCRDITELISLKNNLNKTLNELEEYKRESKFSETFINHKSFDFISLNMKNVYKNIENLAKRDVNMLILGQSGTGKTFMAKKIHEKSKRASGPFTKINCTTIPENLLESELFGYSKGAFTGASTQGKQGLVELSNGGTLFLDEIGELPLNVQSKLLELVQEKTFLPVGGTKLKYVDTRIIAATNKNLMELVKENKFRIDLYYRLSVATINLPPLNELHDDIENLLDFYLKHYNEKHNLNVSFEQKTKEILINYSWPGNIRELEHLIEFLVLTSNNIIITDILPNYIFKNSDASNRISYDNCSLDFILEEEEKKVIQNMFSKYNSSYKLAEKLKISQSKANRLIRKHCNSKEPSQI